MKKKRGKKLGKLILKTKCQQFCPNKTRRNDAKTNRICWKISTAAGEEGEEEKLTKGIPFSICRISFVDFQLMLA